MASALDNFQRFGVTLESINEFRWPTNKPAKHDNISKIIQYRCVWHIILNHYIWHLHVTHVDSIKLELAIKDQIFQQFENCLAASTAPRISTKKQQKNNTWRCLMMRSLGRDDGWKNHGWHHLMMRCFVFYIFWFPQKQHLKIYKEIWRCDLDLLRFFPVSQKNSFHCFTTPKPRMCTLQMMISVRMETPTPTWRVQVKPAGYTMTCFEFQYSL